MVHSQDAGTDGIFLIRAAPEVHRDAREDGDNSAAALVQCGVGGSDDMGSRCGRSSIDSAVGDRADRSVTALDVIDRISYDVVVGRTAKLPLECLLSPWRYRSGVRIDRKRGSIRDIDRCRLREAVRRIDTFDCEVSRGKWGQIQTAGGDCAIGAVSALYAIHIPVGGGIGSVSKSSGELLRLPWQNT